MAGTLNSPRAAGTQAAWDTELCETSRVETAYNDDAALSILGYYGVRSRAAPSARPRALLPPAPGLPSSSRPTAPSAPHRRALRRPSEAR